MRIKIDGVDVLGRVEFARLLGITSGSGFDKRRTREGERFPAEYVRLHGHPYWRRDVAVRYARSWTSSTGAHLQRAS